MNLRGNGSQAAHRLFGDISRPGIGGGAMAFAPMRTRALDQPAGLPSGESVPPSMKIQFKPGNLAKEPAAAVLLAQIADEHFEFIRATPGPEQDVMRGAVEGIQRQYAEQAKITDQMESSLGPAADEIHDEKELAPSLVNQLNELLRCQEYIEMATLFEDSAQQDERQALKLTSLIEKLNDWYVDGIGGIREELQSKREGSEWVRELLRCGSEILINLGIRLAREPSIRAAVQQDLVHIYQNLRLSAQTRHRAMAYMFLEVRDNVATWSVRKS